MKPMFNILAVLALATFCRCDLLSIVADPALRNMLEMSMAEEMADVSDGKCTCENNGCSCCVKLNIGIIKLDGELCAKLSYMKDLKENIEIEMAVTYNGIVILRKEVSVKNPGPICLKIKGMNNAVSVCIEFYELSVQSKKVHGCAKLEVKVLVHKVVSLKLGCFDIPFLEQAGLEKAEHTTLSALFPSKIKRIIELKQIFVETDDEIAV